MILHLLNTSIIPSAPGSWSVQVQPIDTQGARALVRALPYQSHVGHDSTASIMSTLLGVDVPMDRTPLVLSSDPRDPNHWSERTMALVLQLRGRAPEGRILTAEEIEAVGYDFRLMVFAPSAKEALTATSDTLTPFEFLADQGISPVRENEVAENTRTGILGLRRDGSIGYTERGPDDSHGSTCVVVGLLE